MRTIKLLAIAIIALLPPLRFFRLKYLILIRGSLTIKLQLLSTKEVLALLLPHRVILP